MNNVAIIDIGSNSVRMRISSGGTVFLRRTITTRLAQGAKNKKLDSTSVERTFSGITELISTANRYDAKIYAFATAAVRNNTDGINFAKEFFARFSFPLDVVDGEREGRLGIDGAIDGDGTVIDIGGASSEIAVKKNGETIYDFSLSDGAVTLTDLCGKNREKAKEYLNRRIREYGAVPTFGAVYLIGGTATSLAFALSGDKTYDREKNHGRTIPREALVSLTDLLYLKTPEEISADYRIDAKRSEIIHSGAAILSAIFDYLNIANATVSENDNLEGYYKFVLGSHK